jgi:hypothetical protein
MLPTAAALMTTYPSRSEKTIMVFGSNLAGRHGAGSAKHALTYFGAKYGQGFGLQGHAYGIPTKDENLNTLPVARIKQFVDKFLEFAWAHPNLAFHVVEIGCGLAGHSPKDIAPLFKGAPSNVRLSGNFQQILDNKAKPS